jgi:hypothetical protein
MNLYDKSLSNQLAWTQAALDALTNLPPALRNQLAEQERAQHERKLTLEKCLTGIDKPKK